jgi:hypothetical protein
MIQGSRGLPVAVAPVRILAVTKSRDFGEGSDIVGGTT